MKGFTLIELIIVFAILAVLTSVGAASYSGYNNSQIFQVAVADVNQFLTTAKARSLAQVKPTTCGTQSLQGYRVIITQATSTYDLNVVCGGTVYLIERKRLPSPVTFATGSAPSIQFNVSSAAATAGTITINGFSKTKTITVSTTGNISTN